MNIKAIFGENLKKHRKKMHLSQEQLSEKLHISVKHLSAIERGLTFVSAELLEKLSKYLNTPTHCFFRKETEVSNNAALFDSIDRKIEKHLIKAIEEIKRDIRQNNSE
jgi:transcriptional regulator with XRE-family HTH domain